MTTTLLRGGRIHCSAYPGATAVAATDGVISWIGDTDGDSAVAPPADRVIELDGTLVVPGFVDAHVHVTDSGLAHAGLDLTAARSLPQCLQQIADRVRADRGAGGVLWGHGWDETRWPENRPPTRAEIDGVVGGRPVYLTRVDVHSALVSSALVAAAATASVVYRLDGYHDALPPTRAAHAALRGLAQSMVTPGQRADAQAAFIGAAAAAGIVEVHECAASSPEGLADLAALLAAGYPVRVLGYLAAAVTEPEQATVLLAETGAHGLGGDLSVDGAIGSRTAALTRPYTDAASSCGARYLDDEVITAHLLACTRAGIQAGFHAIGDDAVGAVARGLRRAAEALGGTGRGTAMLARCAHRIEHAEMPTPQDIATFAESGCVASVQPLFDAAWGGADGMYVQRLGADRARGMNPFAALAAAGVTLALGSDSPVTQAQPWAAVRAAAHHRTRGSGLLPLAALAAHAAGGRRAARAADPAAGTITVGAPADLAVFAVDAWARDPTGPTDAGASAVWLPDLQPNARLPRCLATLAGGTVIFDGGLFGGTD